MSIKKLSEPLSKEDIEFRIGNTKDGSGFSLLAYKTARTDVKRLNEVFGAGWSNEFFYDKEGLLCCKISIYVKDIEQWVSRIDVGVESKTEKEKGLYSDAFKRAGFKWGIGAELYNFPSIWINWNEWDERNNKKYPKFNANDIVFSEYETEDGSVKKLKLEYKGKVIFEFGKHQKKPTDEPTDEPNDEQKPKPQNKATILFNKLKDHYKCDNEQVKAMLSYLQISSADTQKVEQALNDFGAIILTLDENMIGGR